MMGYDTKLDLLGVRYDAELELRAMHEFAQETGNKCKSYSANDNEFKENCMKLIREQFSYESDVETVWKFIKEDFLQ